MKESTKIYLANERGSAGMKLVIVLFIIVLVGNAGFHYVPVAYAAASLRQEMDTAVVKGLATPGGMRAADVVKAHLTRAVADAGVPPDAIVEVRPMGTHIQAYVAYRKQVDILPFGIYKYNYDFQYTAAPTGYLLKE